MIIVDLPVLENVMNLYSGIKLSGYHLYSSIYETTPKLSFSYTPGYTTPDMLGLAFGSSFPIKWKTELSFEEATQDENNIKNYTGTAAQNNKIIKLAKDGKLRRV